MRPLDFNKVDAYNRELEDWWMGIPPAHDRFVNVILPVVTSEIYHHFDIDEFLEPDVELILTAKYGVE